MLNQRDENTGIHQDSSKTSSSLGYESKQATDDLTSISSAEDPASGDMSPLLDHNDGKTKGIDEESGTEDSYPRAIDRSEWTMKHTIAVLIIRLLIDFLFKNPLLFYNDYASSLNVTNANYAYILIFAEAGAVVAILINSMKFIKQFDTLSIIVTSSFVGGISCILFTFPEFIDFETEYGIVLFCGVTRFFTGISFAFLSASTVRYCILCICVSTNFHTVWVAFDLLCVTILTKKIYKTKTI